VEYSSGVLPSEESSRYSNSSYVKALNSLSDEELEERLKNLLEENVVKKSNLRDIKSKRD
jgi:hypothetical protein